jgi:hypothetical protein
VVVTKIDQNAGDELAHEMLVGKGQSIGDYHAHKASVEGHQRSLGIIWGKLKKQSLTGDEKNALWEEVETRRASIDALKCQMRGCVVDARSSHVVARLKREKAKYLLDGERLPVFCVSNLHYAIHKGAADREGAILDIESTGIPSLRAYALRLAAEVVWKDQEMIFNKLKVAFHGVHSWALRQPVPRTEGLLDAIKKVKSSWEDISEAAAGQCFERFTKEVSGKLLAEHASSNDAAMSYLRRIIEDWHPRTFLAFFRHEGKHATQAVGSHSWNESFIEWQTNNVLNPAWRSWTNPEDAFDNGVEKLINVLVDLPNQLAKLPESMSLPLASFGNVLTGQIELIRAERARIARKYHKRQGNIRLDASLDQCTGYFTQAMKLCYFQGKDDYGSGVCARVKNLLAKHLRCEKPLLKAVVKYERAFESAVSSQASALDTQIKRILDEIDQQLDLILHRDTETLEESRARIPIALTLSQLMPDVDRIELEHEEVKQRYSKALIRR